jgi:hypothetical protein
MTRPRIPQRDPIAAKRREKAAQLRVGIGAQCECGENRPLALIPNSDPIICAACDRIRKGKSPMDKHHIAGQNNDEATVGVNVNDHRAELSPAQDDWEPGLLENGRGCPLAAKAAGIRGPIDLMLFALERLDSVPEMMIHLSNYLEQRLGPSWWVDTPIAQFAPRQRKETQ